MDDYWFTEVKLKIDHYISERLFSAEVRRRYEIYHQEISKYIKDNFWEEIKNEINSLRKIKDEILVSHEKSLLKLKALEELVIGLIKELTILANGVKNA